MSGGTGAAILHRTSGKLLRALSRASDGCWRVRNRARPHVFVYTDSRGFDVTGNRGIRAAGTYVGALRSQFHVSHAICPERYTTIVDFVNHVGGIDLTRFDAVVMHCGVVDFSPRPFSNLLRLRLDKAGARRFSELFEANEAYYARPFDSVYRGERTMNLYSPEYLTSILLPELRRVPNLVWINSNHFVPGWDGNYLNGRPSNIEAVVGEFDELVSERLSNVVDLKSWSSQDVMRYTVDNIHFTPSGFAELASLIASEIRRVVSAKA